MQKIRNGCIILCGCMALCCLSACRQHLVPKPYGYVRLTMPDTCYAPLTLGNYPYSFDVSCNAQAIPIQGDEGEKYWLNLQYPALGATIHCSYQPVHGNLRELTEDAIRFVYRHVSHASAIPEKGFENPEAQVYGVLFDLQGNTASSMQFFITDSVQHFFRAAVYCNCVPNADSLAPVFEYLHHDVVRMVESFRFKEIE